MKFIPILLTILLLITIAACLWLLERNIYSQDRLRDKMEIIENHELLFDIIVPLEDKSVENLRRHLSEDFELADSLQYYPQQNQYGLHLTKKGYIFKKSRFFGMELTFDHNKKLISVGVWKP